jgi:hypothetical protein
MLRSLVWLLLPASIFSQSAPPDLDAGRIHLRGTALWGGGTIKSAAYRAGYVFACGPTTFLTLSATNLTLAGPISALVISDPPATNLQQITLVGDVAYVAEPGFGLRLIDIADPARPKQLKPFPFPTPESSFKVFLADKTLYLRKFFASQAVAVDVSDPRNPSFTPKFHDEDVAYSAGDTWAGADANRNLWVRDLPSGNLLLKYSLGEECLELGVDGGFIYALTLSTTTGGAIYIFKREGLEVTLREKYGVFVPLPPNAYGISFAANRFWLVHAPDTSVYGLDPEGKMQSLATIKDLVRGGDWTVTAQPEVTVVADSQGVLSFFDTNTATRLGGTRSAVQQSSIALGSGFLVGSSGNIFDLSTPDSPKFAHAIVGASSDRSPACEGNLVYLVTTNRFGQRVSQFRLRDDLSPELLGAIEVDENVESIGAWQKCLYISTTNGLAVYNSRLESLGTFRFGAPPYTFQELAFRGAAAYGLRTGESVFVLDVTDPARPLLVTRLRTQDDSDPARQMSLGTRLYVAGSRRVVVYDLSNPLRPVTLGILPSAAPIYEAAPNYVVSAGGPQALILDCTDLSKPSIQGGFYASWMQAVSAPPFIYVTGMQGQFNTGSPSILPQGELLTYIVFDRARLAYARSERGLVLYPLKGNIIERSPEISPALWMEERDFDGDSSVSIPTAGQSGFLRAKASASNSP